MISDRIIVMSPDAFDSGYDVLDFGLIVMILDGSFVISCGLL